MLFIWNLPDQLRPETHAQVYPHQLQKQLQIRDLGERRCGRALIGLSTAAVVVYSLSWRIQMHFKSERERQRQRDFTKLHLPSIHPTSILFELPNLNIVSIGCLTECDTLTHCYVVVVARVSPHHHHLLPPQTRVQPKYSKTTPLSNTVEGCQHVSCVKHFMSRTFSVCLTILKLFGIFFSF